MRDVLIVAHAVLLTDAPSTLFAVGSHFTLENMMRARISSGGFAALGLLLLLSACGGSGDATAPAPTPLLGPGGSWANVTKPTGGTAWLGVAYGNGVWAAVGNGVRGTSVNGSTWTSTTISSTNSFYFNSQVIFANGVFKATSSSGVTTSTNGTSWTGQSLTASQGLRGITYGNGTWVMVDDRFLNSDVLAFFTSTTGAAWTQVMTQIPYAQPTAVAYGNGVFVTVGYGGLVATSANASSWTKRSFGSTSDLGVVSLIFANGMFVAGSNTGAAYSSTDGITWAKNKATPGSMNGLAFGNGVFATVGGSGPYTSPDAITWTYRGSSALLNSSYDALGFGNNQFVAVGGEFLISQ